MTPAAADSWVITIRKPRRRAVMFALAIVVAVALGFGAVVTGTKRVSLDGLSFDVPFGWTVHTQIPPSTAPGDTLALIGTMPWGPCDAYDINCHFAQRLSRNEVEVNVSFNDLLGTDFCTYARNNPDLTRTNGIRVTRIHYFEIDGRPAISTEYSLDTSDYYGSDGWRKWEIGPSSTTGGMYRIFAMWRGPGGDQFLADLDQLVSTISFSSSGQARPSSLDCGAPFPSAAAN
jgi:hypothetical protein